MWNEMNDTKAALSEALCRDMLDRELECVAVEIIENAVQLQKSQVSLDGEWLPPLEQFTLSDTFWTYMLTDDDLDNDISCSFYFLSKALSDDISFKILKDAVTELTIKNSRSQSNSTGNTRLIQKAKKYNSKIEIIDNTIDSEIISDYDETSVDKDEFEQFGNIDKYVQPSIISAVKRLKKKRMYNCKIKDFNETFYSIISNSEELAILKEFQKSFPLTYTSALSSAGQTTEEICEPAGICNGFEEENLHLNNARTSMNVTVTLGNWSRYMRKFYHRIRRKVLRMNVIFISNKLRLKHTLIDPHHVFFLLYDKINR